jgi:hypothetical protein
MDPREKRLAQNEAVFRSVNERIEEIASSGPGDQHVYQFVCECSNADCNLLLPMTRAEYESVRRNPRLFLVAPGHELPEIETVVVRRGPYHIVTKRGEAGAYVEARDPRA